MLVNKKMLGLNEIKSEVDLPSVKIIALCESLLEKMADTEMRRFRTTDHDRYFRTLKSQFSELNDRYPGIFNVLVQYGKKTPDGFQTMDRIREMLRMNDEMKGGTLEREEADKEIDYKYAYQYVRPAVPNFDNIVKPPSEREPVSDSEKKNEDK